MIRRRRNQPCHGSVAKALSDQHQLRSARAALLPVSVPAAQESGCPTTSAAAGVALLQRLASSRPPCPHGCSGAGHFHAPCLQYTCRQGMWLLVFVNRTPSPSRSCYPRHLSRTRKLKASNSWAAPQLLRMGRGVLRLSRAASRRRQETHQRGRRASARSAPERARCALQGP